MRKGEPFFRVEWVVDNLEEVGTRLGEHVYLTVIAVVIGLAISFALALAIRSRPRLYNPIVGVTGTLYAIPSLAFFALLIPFTGTGCSPRSWPW